MNTTKKHTLALISAILMLIAAIAVFTVPSRAASLTKYKLSYSANYAYLTLSAQSSSNSIYYTSNGKKPTAASALYRSRLKISSECVIRVIETNRSGKTVSSLKLTVRPKCAKPSISASDASAPGKILITAVTKTNGAVIRYTTDGSKPGSGSAIYSMPFEVTSGTKVRLIANKKGFSSASAVYTVSAAAGDEDEQPDFADEFQKSVLSLVNKERKAAGLGALTLSPDLCKAAQIRLGEVKQYWSHTRPDGSPRTTLFDELGIQRNYSAENLAAGQTSPEQVVGSWMDSPTHRANILSEKANKLGIAYGEHDGLIYWVQVFTD